MGSDELIANLFRISQTEQKLKRDIGGTMPEDLETPNKSLKELGKDTKIVKK